MKVWRQFEEARKFARSLKLRNRTEWKEYCESNKKPNDIPEYPNDVYNNDWKGMIDWLGMSGDHSKKLESLHVHYN